MDQIYQLQRQIQELRNEINTISQVAGQLQRSEANNAAQLQRLQHNESMATQQLNNIQQLCHHLNQDVNAISNATQQVTSPMFNRPVSSAQFSAPTFSQPITGQYGTITPNMNSLYSSTQLGTYGAQFSPYMSAGSRYGQNFMPDYSFAQQYTAKPVTSSMIPSYTSPMASASSMMPSYSNQQQFGTSGFSSDLSSSTYMPYMSNQISSMPTSHLSSQIPLSTPPNMPISSF
ncbi:MAG: hypothetical protein PHF87_10125 [Desulfotomaculaceae bacterium]|nr:hypothetical protein [Desulfotomaculaceae bacterium]